MDIKFDFEHLSFLSNYQSNEQYSKIGLAELFGAATMSGSDHSAFFDGFSKLIEALEATLGVAIIAGTEYSENAPREMDLTDLLSLKSDNGVASAVYGGALQVHPEMGLVLSFGANHFGIAQNGKTLSIGTLSGELKILDKKREDGSVYYSLFWEVALNDDYDVFFAIPIRKDPNDPRGVAALLVDKDIFKKDILAKSNLIGFVREQSAGSKFKNYGNCPRADGNGDIFKPALMDDGTYVLIGIAHGVLVKKEDGKEFDSVLGYLADGTRISLNSYAKADFIADPESFRFPLHWKMHHLDASRTRSTLCNISAPVAAKTVLPSRFAAFANMALPSAPVPIKSALVGGSSADFEKLAESGNYDDDF